MFWMSCGAHLLPDRFSALIYLGGLDICDIEKGGFVCCVGRVMCMDSHYEARRCEFFNSTYQFKVSGL